MLNGKALPRITPALAQSKTRDDSIPQRQPSINNRTALFMPRPGGIVRPVAIRPEKLRLHFEAPGEAANIVEGRMGPAAYLGDRSHYHVLLPGREQAVAVAVQNMESSVQGLAASDQPVWLSFSSESLVLLGPDD